MEHKHWWDYQMADIPFEDWDVLAQGEWHEYMDLRAEERWERDHGAYEDDREEADDDEY